MMRVLFISVVAIQWSTMSAARPPEHPCRIRHGIQRPGTACVRGWTLHCNHVGAEIGKQHASK